MKEDLVTLQGVQKVFNAGPREVRALRGVDLRIGRGEFLALVGPSGSGKTTLLNLMGGLDRASAGSVTVLGQDLGRMNRADRAEFRLRRLGFVFQAYNLIPVLSALENVEFVLELQGQPAVQRRDTALRIMLELGLQDALKRRPGELSGGQQQRVAVARAVAARPELILADEPTANLDGENAEILMHMMRRMREEHGMSFVFSTHDQRVVAHAERVITLTDGSVSSDRAQASEAPHRILPGIGKAPA